MTASIGRRTVEFQAGTRNLFFHILTRCNLSCRHCYINRKQHGEGMLDRGTMASWLEMFATAKVGPAGPQGAKETNVIFLGGEPTLNPDLPHAIRHARGLGYGSVTIDTNGFLFNHILDKVGPEEVDYFSFSLDGPSPAVNDPIRGKGVFDRCVSGIKEAVKRGFSVSSIFTASAMNIDHLDRMPELLASLGVHRFFIQVIGIRGNPAKDPSGGQLQLTRQRWEEVVP